MSLLSWLFPGRPRVEGESIPLIMELPVSTASSNRALRRVRAQLDRVQNELDSLDDEVKQVELELTARGLIAVPGENGESIPRDRPLLEG